MPEPGIVLDQDQAEDLRELITLAAIVQEWLEHADDPVLGNLADFAYRDTFHPRSYAAWLTEDLAGICGRLRQALSRPQPAQDKRSAIASASQPPARPQDRQDPSGNGIDTSASIGNQIPEPPLQPSAL